jgi:uncharacterized membrane protein
MDESALKTILHYVSLGIGLAGIIIIVYGVVLMLVRWLRLEASRTRKKTIFKERAALRHQLGSYLIFGLEFMIAADLISTFTHPTLNDMAILGSIVAIRTVISIFLDREMADFEPGH